MKRRLGLLSRTGVGLAAAALGCAAWAYYATRSPAATAGGLRDESLTQLEAQLGRHLYAPGWLPDTMAPVPNLNLRGAHRILSNFSDPTGQRWLIIGQELRSPERDAYHADRLIPRADVEAQVGTEKAYFLTGQAGERRLLWRTDDSWLVASSHHLRDAELLHVAQSVR